ncbi:hypothetical protein [Variovorax sp. OK202]|uniref:hypothetical protein n=1 Tax=Variovorax sp. OK202 TaxID=1884311 RepID=UPI001C432466|nr:hypothetical protein [Variovorax sp. OK202]
MCIDWAFGSLGVGLAQDAAGIVRLTKGPAALDADRIDDAIEAAKAAIRVSGRCLSAQTRLNLLVSKCNFIVRNCASGVSLDLEISSLKVEHRCDGAKKAAPLAA